MLNPAESENRALRHEAEISVLKLVLAELMALAPTDQRQRIFAGLQGLAAMSRKGAAGAVGLPEEMVARHVADACNDIERLTGLRTLTTFDWNSPIQFGSPQPGE